MPCFAGGTSYGAEELAEKHVFQQTASGPGRDTSPHGMEAVLGMEHRWNIRLPVRLDVGLKIPQVGLLRGRTSDIGPGGMFIITGPIALQANTPVEALLTLRETNANQSYRIPCVVIRATTEGVGVMFTEFNRSTARALKALLRIYDLGTAWWQTPQTDKPDLRA